MANTFTIAGDEFLLNNGQAQISTRKGHSWYVDTINGNDNNTGKSWRKAFASMSPLDSRLDHGDTIYFSGVLRQNWTAPLKNDVSLIGVGNQPRQATSNGTPNGGGATWLSLASPAVDNLLKVIAQGWHIKNIFFNNADTTKADLWLHRDESQSQDASHVIIEDCVFTGTSFGVKQSGGVAFAKILGCRFFGFAGVGDIAIASETGTGDGTGQQWEIARCRFIDNVHNIVVPLNTASIHDNVFFKIGQSITSTSIINTTSGGHNNISNNTFAGVVPASSPNDTLFVAGTADTYGNNLGTTSAMFGKPANS